MSTESRQGYVSPRKSRMGQGQANTREAMIPILTKIGLLDVNSQYVVSDREVEYVKKILRHDIKLPDYVPLRVRCYSNGNAISAAKDNSGQKLIRVRLGDSMMPFTVGFNEVSKTFSGLFFQDKPLSVKQAIDLI